MKRIPLIAVAVCIAVGLAALAQSPKQPQAGAQAGKLGDEDEVAALERRIENTVRASGTLISLEPGDVKCQVPEAGRIAELVEDGTSVRKGDVLVRLDDTPWTDSLRTQEATVLAAEAAVAQAKATLALWEQTDRDTRENGALAIKAAELARDKYLGDGGEHQLQLKAVESEKEVSQERLKTAETILKALMEAGESGAAAERHLAEARLAAFEAKAAVQLAESKKQLLTTRTLAHQTAVLDLAVAEAKAAQARAARQADAGLAQALGELRKQEGALSLEKSRLERAKLALDRCVIRAPRDGFVVHAAPRGRFSTGNALEVGGIVQPGQLLLQIPNMSRVGVRVLVNETRIERIRHGQEVSVRLEAVPGKVVRGQVSLVANQPEQASFLSGDVRQYVVMVMLEEAPEGIKLGMTASAEIDVGAAGKRAKTRRER